MIRPFKKNLFFFCHLLVYGFLLVSSLNAQEDNLAPGKPLDLVVNGINPGAWNTRSQFILDWTNPYDSSGIKKYYYKMGSRPLYLRDVTGSGPATPPVSIELANEGAQYLYLWLEDGQGNADKFNYEKVLIKYDDTPPVIEKCLIANAQYGGQWINPDSTDLAIIRVRYREMYPSLVQMRADILKTEYSKTKMPGGEHESIDFRVNITQFDDGCYPVFITLSDSVGFTVHDSLFVCIDSTRPDNARVFSPSISSNNQFLISWENENQGDDGAGSGLSGEYDVRVREDDGEWYTFLERTKASSTYFTGVQGHTYFFEVAAWDQVGNREPFNNVAESTTIIVSSFRDNIPPGLPMDIEVLSANQNTWQNSPVFNINWKNPQDPSGIEKIYYKLGSEPESDTDTTGTAFATQNLSVEATGQYGQLLYVWLMDGKGNVNFTEYKSIPLYYDGTNPVIDSVRVLNPLSEQMLFNQQEIGDVSFRIYYDEFSPEKVTLMNPSLPTRIFSDDIPAGENVSFDVELPMDDIPDGKYWIYFSIEDRAGNKSHLDSTLLRLDSTPPRIIHKNDTLHVKPGQPFEVNAYISDENSIENVYLDYWKSGSRNSQTLTMTNKNDSLYQAIIPPDSVTSRGLRYIIRASDGLSESRAPSIAAKDTIFSVQARIMGNNKNGLQQPLPLAFGSDENAFRMISFPLLMDNAASRAVLEDDLGPYNTEKWQFYYWDPSESIFYEYPATDSLIPGRAYWLLNTMPDMYIDTGPGFSVDASTPFVIPLHPGWNDIGNPFHFEIEWQDIFDFSDLDAGSIMGPYTYQGRWLLPFEVETMKPWEGYSLYVESEGQELVIPVLQKITEIKKKESTANSIDNATWYYSIEALQGKSVDSGNLFGSSKEATEFLDYGYDFIEPPEIGSFISAYFKHEDYDLKESRYTTDFKNASNGGVWPLEVSSNVFDQEATLVFHEVKTLPGAFKLALVDVDEQISVDLLQDSTYSFSFTKEKPVKHFNIYVGSTDFMTDFQDAIPIESDEYLLVQNFPQSI